MLRVLPVKLQEQTTLRFDPRTHRLREAAASVLGQLGDVESLETFRPWTDITQRAGRVRCEGLLTDAVLSDPSFLETYEGLVKDVIRRDFKQDVVYQYPPTLRIQPPCDGVGRTHCDAEYGHRPGERNYWLPLTSFHLTQTALLVESKPGDFQPLAVDYGEIVAFYGVKCRHCAPANPSSYTRVSIDFRIAFPSMAPENPSGTDSSSSSEPFVGPLASHYRLLRGVIE